MSTVSLDQHCLTLSGDITLNNVTGLLSQVKKTLVKQTITHVSLKAVEYCDSSALALLIEIQRLSETPLCFEHLPAKLANVAKLSELDNKVLTLQT
tara:strand:- start:26084 stop:26371 length:288 start_codon:yes stop_codon:yes gene_type:complete